MSEALFEILRGFRLDGSTVLFIADGTREQRRQNRWFPAAMVYSAPHISQVAVSPR